MPNVKVEQFREIAYKLFQAAGATDDEIRAVTESLLWASLHGHDTHGAGHFPGYVRTYMGSGTLGGNLNKGGEVTILKETPATIAIDANWIVGHKATLLATEKVIEKAKNTGIAAATVANCPHNGALGFFVNQMTDNDMIGLIFTCSSHVSPPWGGVERMLGTNPLAIGIPAGKEPPIIIDMATSASTWAGMSQLQRAGGGKLPLGILLDDEGELTDDPAAFSGGSRSEEKHGSMANLANNHKGYAVQLAVEMLGGILPALMNGNEAFDRHEMLQTPSLIIVINVSFFQDVGAFKQKVDERIRQIKASKRKSGVDEIFLPGERGFKVQEQRLREGIPIAPHYWEELEKLAQELKVDLNGITSVSGVRAS